MQTSAGDLSEKYIHLFVAEALDGGKLDEKWHYVRKSRKIHCSALPFQEKKNHDEFIFRTYHYVLLVEVIAPRIVPEVNFIKVCVPDLAHDTTAVLPLSVLRHHLFTDI